jgi:hypothetical protein
MTVLVPSPPWRFTVHDLDLQTVTILDRLAINRNVTYALNLPALATLDLPSDSPEVNITQGGEPFVAGGDRILMGFRREGQGSLPRPLGYDPNAPYVPRFGGIIAPLGREAQVDQPWTHVTASDPWAYWGSRPVVNDIGVLPGRGGITYGNDPVTPMTGDQIAITVLTNSLAAHGNLYVDFGQTPFYGGTIETTDPILITFDQGLSVGEALKKLTDTGSMDIILTAIYDPINRPGIIAEVSIYNQAGIHRNGAIFAWDMPSHSLNGIDLLHDFTQLANKIALTTSTANVPVDVVSDATSIAKYGEYWLLQAIQGQASLAAADLLALSKLALFRNGKDTLTLDPHPERAPVPFNEYLLGDEVPVYASDDFGEVLDAGVVNSSGSWTNLRRIYAIPLDIADDQVETVTQMLMSSS